MIHKTAAIRVLEYINENGISQEHLAQKCKLKSSILKDKLIGKAELTADDIAVICQVLGCSPSDFLNEKDISIDCENRILRHENERLKIIIKDISDTLKKQAL